MLWLGHPSLPLGLPFTFTGNPNLNFISMTPFPSRSAVFHSHSQSTLTISAFLAAFLHHRAAPASAVLHCNLHTHCQP